MVVWRLSDWVPLLSPVAGLLTAAVVIYIPVYLARAMAVVYRQGVGLLTMLKFVFLIAAYFASLSITLVLTLLVTALTI